LNQELLSPEENQKQYRRGQLYVMIGNPKCGKTTLAKEIGRRLSTKLWVVDHDDYGTGRTHFGLPDYMGTCELLQDHFANSNLDVLLVMRGNRSWFSDPLGTCPRSLFAEAAWVFGIQERGVVIRETCPPITVPDRRLGYTWKCWTIKDRHNVYNSEWVWDSSKPDHEFWSQHVKPICLNDPESMRAYEMRRDAVPVRTFEYVDVGHRSSEEVEEAIKRWREVLRMRVV